MESVLVKANLVNLSTSQSWLIFNGEKGMLDHEGHVHKAVVYKSHFPPLRHSVVTETLADTLANKPRLHTKPYSLSFMPPRQNQTLVVLMFRVFRTREVEKGVEVKGQVLTDLVLDAMAEAALLLVRMKMTMILKRKRSTMIDQERRKEAYPTSLSMKQVSQFPSCSGD